VSTAIVGAFSARVAKSMYPDIYVRLGAPA
jgi:hypothetical protein